MARPLRLSFPGATYHIISRGNEQKQIYSSDSDYIKFLDLLARTKEKFDLKIFAYCLMTNHYHLLLETPQANISKAMQYLNSAYSGYYNARHKRVGHLLQGRYKAILVEKDNYLLELTRYIHLNPVRAKIVENPSAYRWSSYRVYEGREKTADWLSLSEVMEQFSANSQEAFQKYKEFVEDRLEEKVKENLLSGVVYQCFLGGRRFVETMKAKVETPGSEVSYRKGLLAKDPQLLVNLVRKQKLGDRWEKKLSIYFLRRYSNMSLQEICDYFGGGHYSTVGQTVKRLEQQMGQNKWLKQSIKELEKKMSNVEV